MRAEGKNDEEIIKFLGLQEKVPFKMNKKYLEKLFGFLTSRKSRQGWTQKALEYGYQNVKEQKVKTQKSAKPLSEY